MRKPRTGKGMLKVGNPGNMGGPGRPPSELRERLRGSFAERIPVLEDVADGRVSLRLVGTCEQCGHEGEPLTLDELKALAPAVADRLKAIDLMGKYGLGANHEMSVDAIRARLAEQIRRIQAALPKADAERVLALIRPVWE